MARAETGRKQDAGFELGDRIFPLVEEQKPAPDEGMTDAGVSRIELVDLAQ